MPVVTTPVKNQPSKRSSRDRMARRQVSVSGTGERSTRPASPLRPVVASRKSTSSLRNRQPEAADPSAGSAAVHLRRWLTVCTEHGGGLSGVAAGRDLLVGPGRALRHVHRVGGL